MDITGYVREESLKVHIGMIKVMILGDGKDHSANFRKSHKVRVESTAVLERRVCRKWLNLSTYLRMELCELESMEGNVRERAVKGRQVISAWKRIIVCMYVGVKKTCVRSEPLKIACRGKH